MEEEWLEDEFDDLVFSRKQLKMFATIIKRQPIAIDILKMISERTLDILHHLDTIDTEESSKANKLVPVTIKEITENIKIERRVGVKPLKNNGPLRYDNKNEFISRKMAESIISNLEFASLISTKNQTTYKYLIITPRGLALHFYLLTELRLKMDVITKQEAETFLSERGIV